MIKRKGGFSLIEMMIAMAIVLVVLASAMSFFIISAQQFKHQTKLTASGLEGIMGLELLRRDLEDMGFGLPWNNLPAYTEATGNAAELNDAAAGGLGVAPRAIVGLDNPAFTLNNSDYFAIKSAKVGVSSAAGKWTHLNHLKNKRIWSPASENMNDTDRVIVLSIGSADSNRRSLVVPGSNFYTTYSNTDDYVPDRNATNIVYGIGDELSAPLLVRPFNRADYFVSTSYAIPKHCAPGTGMLVKGVLNSTSGLISELPVLDCVADMQVAYNLYNTATRTFTWTADLGIMTAAQIREQLVEVRVSILAHEGQRDDGFTYPQPTIMVGAAGVGRNFTLNANQRHYRWKLYNLAVKPLSMAQ